MKKCEECDRNRILLALVFKQSVNTLSALSLSNQVLGDMLDGKKPFLKDLKNSHESITKIINNVKEIHEATEREIKAGLEYQ